MTETTIVHLLRHGEVHNPRGVLYGRLPDFHLSEDGHLMAKAAADFLGRRDIAAVYTSPLERAQETAAPLAEATGLTPIVDDRLIEAENVFEGEVFTMGRLADPRVWPRFRNPFSPSWGEPFEVVARRMNSLTEDARRAARGHEAVCVSHQLPIYTARRRAEGLRLWHDPRRRQCGLASVTSLIFEGETLARVDYHEPAAHLIKGPTVPGA
ncbi:histidine phosphatase family protein [Actinocorallia sp. A-T 12471]|uniref:histidine phosphatase family protein n=1 Tax=Actinocorallia sp. A-T 12471 TaxID=3089813 RepID=UPI0029D320FD|nr:histidine phosphatase family protein [Actinocorallia sp. A-T 12471]MDX6741764.1 histidine phosphatase family protein [Actinocorallia sp. A-T 12471]